MRWNVFALCVVLLFAGCSSLKTDTHQSMKRSQVDVVMHNDSGFSYNNTGSGVVVDVTGGYVYVLTANHVVNNLDEGVTPAIAQRVFRPMSEDAVEFFIYSKAKVIERGEVNDLALLKAKYKAGFLFDPVPLYKGTDLLPMGTDVYHVGTPHSRSRTMTKGMISRYEKSLTGNVYMNVSVLVQPGSSGGPVFTTDGELIGVISLGDTGVVPNIGMAVPYFVINRWVEENNLTKYFE